jgi:hypothetical protein
LDSEDATVLTSGLTTKSNFEAASTRMIEGGPEHIVLGCDETKCKSSQRKKLKKNAYFLCSKTQHVLTHLRFLPDATTCAYVAR